MAEYIEREALLAEYDRLHTGEPGRARKLIAEAPAADVVEVVHGRWILAFGRLPRCSCCKTAFYGAINSPANYCPNCGARMDGE